MKLISKFFYILTIFLLLIVGSIIATSAFNFPKGIKFFSVQSGSMEPTISVGSIVIVKKTDDYKKDDIITFKSQKDQFINLPKSTTTHRIFNIKEEKSNIVYITKGDANSSADSVPVNKELILGKTVFHIPLVGYLVSFAKTKEGFIFLIIIPSTIIVYSELITIKKETIKLLTERKKRKLTMKEKIEEKIGEEIIAIEKDIKEVAKKI